MMLWHRYLAQVCHSLTNICAFSSFLLFVMEKDVKMLKKMILTSEQHAKYLFTGQNTQHMNLNVMNLLIFLQMKVVSIVPSGFGLNSRTKYFLRSRSRNGL